MKESLENYIFFEKKTLWFHYNLYHSSTRTYTKSEVQNQLKELTRNEQVRKVGFHVNCVCNINKVAVIEWLKNQVHIEELFFDFLMPGSGIFLTDVEELVGAFLLRPKAIKKIEIARVYFMSQHFPKILPNISSCTNLKSLSLWDNMFDEIVTDWICSAMDAIEMLGQVEIRPIGISRDSCKKLTRSLIKKKNLSMFRLFYTNLSADLASEFLLLSKFNSSLHTFILYGTDTRFKYPQNFRLSPSIKTFQIGHPFNFRKDYQPIPTKDNENQIENPHLQQELRKELSVNEKTELIFTEPVEEPVKIDCTNVTSISIFNQDEVTFAKCISCLSGSSVNLPVRKTQVQLDNKINKLY